MKQNCYIVYVNGIRFGRAYGWYEARLLMQRLKRKYPNQRVTKVKDINA